MIPHRGTEITEKNRASVFSAALCEIFFYNPTQRHRDHRENRASVFFAALCEISDCGPPLNPL